MVDEPHGYTDPADPSAHAQRPAPDPQLPAETAETRPSPPPGPPTHWPTPNQPPHQQQAAGHQGAPSFGPADRGPTDEPGWTTPPVDDAPWTNRIKRRVTPSQARIIAVILALAAATIAYRLVYLTGVQRASALYVGVPTVLAIGLALVPRTRSATGMMFKGTTLALLMALVVLPEGVICLIFALPLTAAVSAVVGGAIDAGRRRGYQDRRSLMAVSLPLMVMSLEGVVGTPFDPRDAAVATITVDATPEAVEAALAQPPRFDRELPAFLTLGFNRPRHARGEGLEPGDQRFITFGGGSHDDHPMGLGEVVNGHGETEDHSHQSDDTSEMVLTVAARSDQRVVFDVDRDDTMLSRWARLDRAVVTWSATDDGRTEVTWRLEFERLLAPAFYFGPLQRYGLGLAADHLLQVVVAEPVATASEAPREAGTEAPDEHAPGTATEVPTGADGPR